MKYLLQGTSLACAMLALSLDGRRSRQNLPHPSFDRFLAAAL